MGRRVRPDPEHVLAVEEILEGRVHLEERAGGDTHVEQLVAVEEVVEATGERSLREVWHKEYSAQKEPGDLLDV